MKLIVHLISRLKITILGAGLLVVKDVLTVYFKTTIQYIEKIHYKRLLVSCCFFREEIHVSIYLKAMNTRYHIWP